MLNKNIIIHQEATTLIIYVTLCLIHFLYFYCIFSDEDLDKARKSLLNLNNICILKLNNSWNYCLIFAEVEKIAALILVTSLFKENQEWLFIFGDVCIYFWMLFLYRCMLCAMPLFKTKFVCITRVLFFIKLLCETNGIFLVLCFQMISNLAEALYLICMFIILQQIVQPPRTPSPHSIGPLRKNYNLK